MGNGFYIVQLQSTLWCQVNFCRRECFRIEIKSNKLWIMNHDEVTVVFCQINPQNPPSIRPYGVGIVECVALPGCIPGRVKYRLWWQNYSFIYSLIQAKNHQYYLNRKFSGILVFRINLLFPSICLFCGTNVDFWQIFRVKVHLLFHVKGFFLWKLTQGVSPQKIRKIARLRLVAIAIYLFYAMRYILCIN